MAILFISIFFTNSILFFSFEENFLCKKTSEGKVVFAIFFLHMVVVDYLGVEGGHEYIA